MKTFTLNNHNEYPETLISEIDEFCIKIIEGLDAKILAQEYTGSKVIDIKWLTKISTHIHSIAQGIEISQELEDSIKLGSRVSEWKYRLTEFVIFAILDVFLLFLLHENFWIKKWLLIWFAIMNMKSWLSSDWSINISNVINWYYWNSTPSNSRIIPVEYVIDYFKGQLKSKLWDSVKCPFYFSQEKNKWINNLWMFFEDKLFPELKELGIENDSRWGKFLNWELWKSWLNIN